MRPVSFYKSLLESASLTDILEVHSTQIEEDKEKKKKKKTGGF